MAEAIGSVKVTFTASASGLVGAVNQSVVSIDGMRASLSNTAVAQESQIRKTQASASAMREAAKITRDVRTPAEQYAASVAKLDNFLSRGLVTQEVYARAVAKAQAELDGATVSANQTASATSRLSSAIQAVGGALSGLANFVNTIASAVKSVADAGSSIAEFGVQVAKATAVWRIFDALTRTFRSPEGLLAIVLQISRALAVIKVAEVAFGALGVDVEGVASFATKAALAFGAFKAAVLFGANPQWLASAGAALSSTLPAALAKVGVPIAATSTALSAMGTVASFVGTRLAGLAGLSIPGFGQVAAAAYITVKALLASRDAAYETATAVAALGNEAKAAGVKIEAMQVQKLLDAGAAREEILRLGLALSSIQLEQFDNLAFSAERNQKAGQNLSSAFASLGTTIAGSFTGLFSGFEEGMASLTGGLADVVGGINAIASPIASVIQPFGSLLGTIVQGVMQLGGAFLSVVGVVARFAGVLLNIAASPFIVGLSNFANAIRQGVGGAFQWFSDKITYVHKQLDWLQNALAKIPIIGRAFASSEGSVPKPPAAAAPAAPSTSGAADAAEAAREAAAAEGEELRSVEQAIRAQEAALSSAINLSSQFGQAGFDAALQYQDGLRKLEEDLKKGILNETSFAAEAGKLKEQFDSQIDAMREQKRVTDELASTVQKNATAGAELGAAAGPIRDEFNRTANEIRENFSKGFIDADEARSQMAQAVDGMNEELKRLGEDQKFAEKIREGLKSATDKVKEELAAIDNNQTLTDEEKTKAKDQVKEKAKASLPGAPDLSAADQFRESMNKLKEAFDAGIIDAGEYAKRQEKLREDTKKNLPGAKKNDAVDQFREDSAKLKEALKAGMIDPKEFAERQATLKEELDASVSDLREKQEKNKQPDRRAVGAVDVNSSEGASTFFRLLRGQDDPTKKQLEEMRKQTRLLEKVAQAEAEVVQI